MLDHCTLSPEGDWSLCCEAHDREYEDPEATDRAAADKHLRECIAARGHRVVCWIYWIGVRLFGWWFWKRDRPLTRLVDRCVGAPVRMLRRIFGAR